MKNLVHTFKMGTKATRFELVGIICPTSFGELLFSTGDLHHLCELVGESRKTLLNHTMRFSEIILVKPGERRPIEYRSNDETWFSNAVVDQARMIDDLLESAVEPGDWIPCLAEQFERECRQIAESRGFCWA